MSDIVTLISSDLIDDPEHAMRSELDRNDLFELADNIKQNGLINPITVRPRHIQPNNEADCSAYPLVSCKKEHHLRYEVVAGHRRFSACKINGMVRIPCVVRELDDKQTFAVMAAENLERSDVDPVDEAVFISEYIKQTSATVAEVAKVLRRSVQYVETRLAVGEMPDYMKDALKSGNMKLGVALALLQITDDNVRHVWCDMAVRDGVSVAQAEYWLHGWRVNQLPGGSDDLNPPSGYEPGVSQPVLFECALDGKKYDARLTKVVMIAEANMPIFLALANEYRTLPEPTANPPHSD